MSTMRNAAAIVASTWSPTQLLSTTDPLESAASALHIQRRLVIDPHSITPVRGGTTTPHRPVPRIVRGTEVGGA